MSRYNSPERLTNKERISRIALGLAMVIVLGIFCPKDTTITLDYKLNEPWEEGALIARDSFEIFKSPEAIAKERDSLHRYYEPYYEHLPDIGEAQVQQLKERLSKDMSDIHLTSSQCNRLTQQMEAYYAMGILPDSSYSNLQQNKITLMHIFSSNESQRTSAQSMKSQRMVYQEMMKENEDMRNALQNIKLDRYIVANLRYDKSKSSAQQHEVNQMLTYCSGRVQVGEKIVDRGQIVTQAIMEKLASYEIHETNRQKTRAEKWSKVGGEILFITIIIAFFTLFIIQFRHDYLKSWRVLLLISLFVTCFTVLTYQTSKIEFMSVLIIPFSILPISLRIFTDSRMAFFAHLCTLLLCSIALDHPYEFIVLQSITGLTALLSLRDMQQRSDLFRTAVFVVLAAEVMQFCIDLMNMNFFNVQGVNPKDYISLAAGGGLLLLSYLLLFPLEKLFKFTSSVTLVELSNTNHPILRKLSEEAPGTFQHSIQVSNLAAAVAQHLDAKVQLVRTAALYHDIGKLKDPVFFTENQNGTNPHDKYSCEESAQIIIQHVKYGLELANKYNLPQCIKDFIATHHGRTKTKFFYITYMNQHPGENINGEIFTYPGPNPTTREEAILMMADTVEAASRSLSEYTEESISAFVDRIIDGQVKEGCFNLCPITFENINKAKTVFKEKLKSIYHTRISYPELKN